MYQSWIGNSLVSQAKSVWQELLEISVLLLKDRRLRRISGWILGLGTVALLCWLHWKLFLATTVGISLMCWCYARQNSHWQRYWQKWQNLLVGSNRQLAIAVTTGASGAFGTYLAASIWADVENQWLATGSILQGLLSLITLALVWSTIRNKQASSLEAKLESLLAELSHGDRLKRLVAIRQLTRLLISKRLSAEHYSQSIEYYRLMLAEPQVPAIKNALLESLAILGDEDFSPQPPALKIPLKPLRDRQLITEGTLQ
ncbi:MAG: ATP synthase subunit I [Cyanobacteria bacterium J06621_8]